MTEQEYANHKSKRPARLEGGVAYVQLTRGYEATIDAIDADIVSRLTWSVKIDLRADGSFRSAYAITNVPRLGGGYRTEYLHRILLGGCQHVDHIDGNGLNNRRSNLRPASRAENARNRRANANNKTGFKGVHFHKRKGKWQAYINVNGKRLHLGRFDTADEAASAYAQASADLHGVFGRLA